MTQLGPIRDTRPIAHVLSATRFRRGLTQLQVGRAMRVSASRIADYEALRPRRAMPKFDTLVRYADVLGLEIHVTIRPKESQ